MDSFFNIVFRHFPLITFIVICVNALIWWIRGRHTRREFPERTLGYKRIIAWFVGYSAIICALVELEILFGAHGSIIELFEIGSIGPFGIAAAIFTFALSPLLAFYIYINNGAEDLTKHPGLANQSSLPISEKTMWMIIPVIVLIGHIGFLINFFAFKSSI